MLIDTHCHLNYIQDRDSLMSVLERARENGIDKIIDVACEPASWQKGLLISEDNDNVFSAIGLHPHEHKSWDGSLKNKMISFLRSSDKVKALGEIGLDYFYLDKEEDLEMQKKSQQKVFIDQLELARLLDLPVIIHTRDAEMDTIEILRKYQDLKIVIHCFSGTEGFAEQMIDFGFYLSFTGMVTFSKMSWLKDILKKVPENRLMIETDSPFLAPVPMRGKTNEPSYLAYTFEFIAEQLDQDSLMQNIYHNSVEFFDLK